MRQESEALVKMRQKKLERERRKDGKNVTNQYVTTTEKGDNAVYDIDKIVEELDGSKEINKSDGHSSESSPSDSKKKNKNKKGKK